MRLRKVCCKSLVYIVGPVGLDANTEMRNAAVCARPQDLNLRPTDYEAANERGSKEIESVTTLPRQSPFRRSSPTYGVASRRSIAR